MPKKWLRMIIFATCFTMVADDWKTFYRENRKRFNDEKEAAASILDCAKYDTGEAAKFLLRIACRRSVPINQRAQALWVLRQYKSDEAKAAIRDCFKRFTAYDAHTLAFAIDMELLSTQDILSLISHNDPTVAAVAIRGLGGTRKHSDGTVKKICGRMRSALKHRSIQIAGMEALAGINSRLSMPTLIERLGDLRYQGVALDALIRLTGQNHGADVKAWQAWFDENPEFTPVNTSVSAYLEKKKKEGHVDVKKCAEFYGMRVTGKNVLFVLDHSESMRRVRGKITRLNRLKEEFKAMSDELPETVRFGVLLFPDNAYFPSTFVCNATDAFKRRINRYLEKVKPDGTTPIEEAMVFAFEKIVDRRKIDTIYLLSDGSPNGRSAVVRRTIQELNRGRNVKINTLSLDGNSTFLKEVAADNHGEYMVIGK